MIIDKSGDKIIAMVVAFLHPHIKWVVSANTCLFEASRLQFLA
jgi:hypothetical protein